MRLLIHNIVAHPVIGLLTLAADGLDLVRSAALHGSVFLTGIADLVHDVTAPDSDDDDAFDDDEDGATLVVERGPDGNGEVFPFRCPDCGDLIGGTTRVDGPSAMAFGVALESHRPKCSGSRAS